MKRRPIHFGAVILLAFLTFGQATGQFDGMVESISAYNQKFPKEAVYVHMDREVYNPGDTLWFKVYLRDHLTLTDATISLTISVKLLNSSGRLVHESKHPVFQSESVGQIPLDKNMGSGNYKLICYSSWMKNDTFSELYQKSFRLKEESLARESFRVILDRAVYQEGDTITGSIDFLDRYSEEIKNARVRCRVGQPGRYLSKFNIKTGEGMNLRIPVSRELLEHPHVDISTQFRGFYFDTLIHLPVPKNFNVGFYPEGGNLVAGLSNRVAFKATTENQLDVSVSGRVVTEDGSFVTEIQSEHQGMGVFSIFPEAGRKYYLEVTDPPNQEERFALPEALDQGWLLKTAYNKRKLSVSLSHTFGTTEAALVLISVRGVLISYLERSVTGFDTFSIPTENIPAGIAVVTLFDSSGEARAERLVYINPEDQNLAVLESDRKSYLPRDSVALRIKVTDQENKPVTGSFSLSVVDQQLGMSAAINEHNVISSLYLGPEIKGRVSGPEYYFNSKQAIVSHHLDLLLMTQGWRRFRYESMLNSDMNAKSPPQFQDVVYGQLLKYKYARNGVPAHGTVRVYNAGGTADFETDENGRFRYLHTYSTELNPNIMLFGYGDDPEDKVEIILDPDHFEEEIGTYFKERIDSLFRIWYQHPEPEVDFMDQYMLGVNNQWIEEVIVYGNRRKDYEFAEEGFTMGSQAPDDLIRSSHDVYGILVNMGLPIEWGNDNLVYSAGLYAGPLTWFVDDFQRDYDFVRSLWTGDIKALFVVKFPDTQQLLLATATEDQAMMVITIHTVPFSEWTGPPRRRNSVILPKLATAREFYRPRYDTEAKKHSSVPDLRKTIHWEPRVTLDEHGEATITYYNGDRYTRVSCILEGISDKGIPVHSESSYNVYTIRE